jgi:hypothetical protein
MTLPNYPRRKAAKPDIEPESQLPKLTLKQSRFVNALLSGKTMGQAYRDSHDCSKMQPNSIAVAASRLANSDKIALSLRLAQRSGMHEAVVTRDNHLSELARLRELAVDNQQVSAGVQAEHYRGRVAGLYNDKLSLTVGPSDEALLSQLAQLLGPDAVKLVEKALAPAEVDLLALPPPLETEHNQ